MRKLSLSALVLVASTGVAFAQAASPATPSGAQSAAPATAGPNNAPRSAQPPVFGAPGAGAATASAPINVPANIGTLIQQATSAKVQKCAAKGPGYYWKPNNRYGQARPDGTPSLSMGSCKARKFTMEELRAANVDQGTISRIIAVDQQRPN